MIYFVRVSDGRIKIGTTCDLQTRMSAIGRLYGKPVRFMATIPGFEAEEREIHDSFHDIRIPRSELFKSMPKLLDFVTNLPRPVARDTYEARELQYYFNYGPDGLREPWLSRDPWRLPIFEVRDNRLVYRSPAFTAVPVGG